MLGASIKEKKKKAPENDESSSHVGGGMEYSEQPVNTTDQNLVLSTGSMNQRRTLQTERVEAF